MPPIRTRPQRLLVLGGTGFVGSHLLARLAADGHRIVVLSRHRERHRALEVLPTVRVKNADIRDDAVLRRHLAGMDAVINLVGILNPARGAGFRDVHVELVRRLIAAMLDTGVPRLHQMSALKAGQGLSDYLKTRGEAEALVKASPLRWTLYQPSVIFGAGDRLVRRFARMLHWLPVLPLARSTARLAPTHVGDVSAAIARCVAGPGTGVGATLELAGPEVLTLGGIVAAIRTAAGLRTPILALPDSLGRVQAELAGLLPGTPFSLDNFRSLRTDSLARSDGYATLGIQPQAFTPWLPTLLGRAAGHGRRG